MLMRMSIAGAYSLSCCNLPFIWHAKAHLEQRLRMQLNNQDLESLVVSLAVDPGFLDNTCENDFL